MDSEFVWGAVCGDCGARIFRADVPVGRTLEQWLSAHKEMECLAQVGPRLRPWRAQNPAINNA
ncbi:MAG: hypothetical protein LC623_03470 [Halobacteriales archaeon]|nr:hypothetical protein [Halobacteriales archaeon]